jgi:hypothetical protein
MQHHDLVIESWDGGGGARPTSGGMMLRDQLRAGQVGGRPLLERFLRQGRPQGRGFRMSARLVDQILF